MRATSFRRLLLISLLGLLFLIPAVSQAQQEPVVRAVLFYSPTCPHCHHVINEVLIPMVEEYGQQLQIVPINVTRADGQALYQSAIAHFEIPEERRGVPMLIVGDTVLVGSFEIPVQFPVIVSDGLSTGVDWPAIPGFVPPVEAAETSEPATLTTTPAPSATITPSATATPAASATPMASATLTASATATTSALPSATVTTQPAAGEDAPTTPVAGQLASETQPTPAPQPTSAGDAPVLLDSQGLEIALEDPEDPLADPVGFALASIILVLMVSACIHVVRQAIMPIAGRRDFASIRTASGLSSAIPLIAILGIGVAAYLAYVETNQVAAVCGPVGHCNLVQSSTYARILGIPIAILGLISYVVIILLWVVQLVTKQDGRRMAARLGLVGLAMFGTLFSIYLTLLELFVIRAVCVWCLGSAVFMTLLMVLAVRPTRRPLRQAESLS